MKLLLKNRWFWLLLSVFIVHQILEKGLALRLAFVNNYLDDLLCMPILLSGWLAEQHDLFGKNRLSAWEIGLFFVFLSLTFEWLLPKITIYFTADIWDVVCYGLGSLFFHYYINTKFEDDIAVSTPLKKAPSC